MTEQVLTKLTKEQKKKAIVLSEKQFGTSNLSKFYGYLIDKLYNETK
jgi:hypothetical protein